MEVDADVGVIGVDIGPCAKPFAELIDYGVFDPQGGILAVGQGGIGQGGVHGKGQILGEMFVPENSAGVGVECVRVRGVEPGQFEQDARGKP